MPLRLGAKNRALVIDVLFLMFMSILFSTLSKEAVERLVLVMYIIVLSALLGISVWLSLVLQQQRKRLLFLACAATAMGIAILAAGLGGML
jgi:cytochrome bd-type quinol oxidase subunit 2